MSVVAWGDQKHAFQITLGTPLPPCCDREGMARHLLHRMGYTGRIVVSPSGSHIYMFTGSHGIMPAAGGIEQTDYIELMILKNYISTFFSKLVPHVSFHENTD